MEQPIGLSDLHPMQPRFNRIEAGLPRTKASLQSHNSSPTFNPQHIKHYYKAVSKLKVIYTDNISNDKLNSLSRFTVEKKFTRDYTRRGG
jgi:hypothetical protein